MRLRLGVVSVDQLEERDVLPQERANHGELVLGQRGPGIGHVPSLSSWSVRLRAETAAIMSPAAGGSIGSPAPPSARTSPCAVLFHHCAPF
jgi:hypothetical protein